MRRGSLSLSDRIRGEDLVEKMDVMSDGVEGIRHRLLLKATARTSGHERHN